MAGPVPGLPRRRPRCALVLCRLLAVAAAGAAASAEDAAGDSGAPAAGVAAAAAAAAAASVAGAAAEGDDKDAAAGVQRQAGEAHAGATSVSRAKELTQWADDDPVEVYYAEFLLAQWVLDRAPWNAYHSGLAFVNNRTQQKALFDYTPEDVSSVMNMVVPQVRFTSQWEAVVMGEYEFVWRDQAHTQFFAHWPDNYNNFVLLGHLNGTVFRHFADWVEAEFAPTHKAFQPVEVAVAGRGNVVRSRMCHDFVTDALWVLHRDEVLLKAEDAIFRDHIIMYASGTEPARELVGTPRGKRQWLRYLRGISLFLEEIKQQFTHARTALIAAWKLGIPIFLHNEQDEYRVLLVPPFLNYCYLPLAIPPAVHDPFGALKLCALGMQANMSNTTAPWPWGPLLAAEERLDRPEALPALLLVVLAAAFGALPRRPKA